MTETTFKLDAKAISTRFQGQEVKLLIPSTRTEALAFVADSVGDEDARIVALANSQTVALSKQKKVKDVLGSDAVKDMDVPTALEYARKEAEALQIGAPRSRTGGGSAKVRAENAEKRVEAANGILRDSYLQAPKAFRKTLRDSLLAGEIFTAAELDEMDASAA